MFFQKFTDLMTLSFAKIRSFPVQFCPHVAAGQQLWRILNFPAGTLRVFVLLYSLCFKVSSAPRNSCAKSECFPDFVWEEMSRCFLFLLGDWVLGVSAPFLELSSFLRKLKRCCPVSLLRQSLPSCYFWFETHKLLLACYLGTLTYLTLLYSQCNFRLVFCFIVKQ